MTSSQVKLQFNLPANSSTDKLSSAEIKANYLTMQIVEDCCATIVEESYNHGQKMIVLATPYASLFGKAAQSAAIRNDNVPVSFPAGHWLEERRVRYEPTEAVFHLDL